MKKKALIATIFIGVTGLVLAGYFVGCGQQQPAKSQVATKDSAQKLDLEKEAELSSKIIAELPEAAEERSIEAGKLRPQDKLRLAPLAEQHVADRLEARGRSTRAKIVNGPVPSIARYGIKPGRAGKVPVLHDRKLGRDLFQLRKDNLGYDKAGSAYADKKPLPQRGRRIPAELLNVTADEIWVIARPEIEAVVVDEDTPGCGAMLAKLPGKDKEIPLPLKHTDVIGQISGYIATVEVIQQFHNPYDEKIEAVYVFPLPQNAAINEFIMTIGDRRIRGIIRERAEAERIYEQARSQGYVASLLTQERPNIFTQKVANIEPSKEIDVNIKYFNTLAYVDGWYEFVFPMVVGPRYNPPGFSDGVGAVGRGTRRYLRAENRSAIFETRRTQRARYCRYSKY